MQQFSVNIPFTVQYLDPDDMTGPGVYTVHKRCAGQVEAATREAAHAIITRHIEQSYPFCWRLDIAEGEITPQTGGAGRGRHTNE